jgi:pyruvate/2-oxoglutarate dehydrogenase complex dihydrolipoamide acyltransferase (E2) component
MILTKNKDFGKPIRPSLFRRLAIGSWGAQGDPTIYGVLELNAEKALAFIANEKQRTGSRITINHFVGKVFAKIMEIHPELNCEIRWGKFYPRKSIDIAFQVAIEKNRDLSSGVVRNVNHKSLSEIADDLNGHAHDIRKKNDPGFKGVKKISQIIPGVFQRAAVSTLQFFMNTLNLWTPIFGVPKDAFGSLMITNVGSLGLDFALPALFPPAGVPMIIAVGALFDAPVYEKNEDGTVKSIRLEKHLKICGAFDHRYLDGLHGSLIAQAIRKYFANPDMDQQADLS